MMAAPADETSCILGRPGQYRRYLSYSELLSSTDACLREHPGLLERRVLGESRQGRPIELLSIGEGRRSILVVGAPHPNEPVGCLAVEFMIHRLCGSEAARNALPFRWHFVKAAEPDGLVLNEGWFGQPACVETYLEHFFRPAFIDQAEYGFPFPDDVGRVVVPSPENDAYRRAFALAQPCLFLPLHNADYGGAFYFLSAGMSGAASTFSRIPAGCGLGVNPSGEAVGRPESLSDGVFPVNDIARLVRTAAASKYTGLPWSAGNSSCCYAAWQGAQAVNPEVSRWDGDDDPAWKGATVGDVQRARRNWCGPLAELGLMALAGADSSADILSELFRHAVEESVAAASHGADSPVPDEADAQRLSARQHRIAMGMLRLVTLRWAALARALCARSGNASTEAACRAYIRSGTQSLLASAGFRAAPLQNMVTVQVQSILTAAAHLR